MYTKSKLTQIFQRTDGNCHLCGKLLHFSNYSAKDKRGNWEVEHSVPQSKGGSGHSNNLYAACISCNRSKGTKPTRIVRAQNGLVRAPYSAARKSALKKERTYQAGLVGLGLTALITTNPIGLLIGAATGVILSSSAKSNE